MCLLRCLKMNILLLIKGTCLTTFKTYVYRPETFPNDSNFVETRRHRK